MDAGRGAESVVEPNTARVEVVAGNAVLMTRFGVAIGVVARVRRLVARGAANSLLAPSNVLLQWGLPVYDLLSSRYSRQVTGPTHTHAARRQAIFAEAVVVPGSGLTTFYPTVAGGHVVVPGSVRQRSSQPTPSASVKTQLQGDRARL